MEDTMLDIVKLFCNIDDFCHLFQKTVGKYSLSKKNLAREENHYDQSPILLIGIL